MRARLLTLLAGVVTVLGVYAASAQTPPVPSPQQPAPAAKHRPTGARPSPRHKFLTTPRHVPRGDIPAAFLVLPPQLNIYGNDTWGDCVSAEEAFKFGAWSVQIGLPELFIDPNTLVAWARRHGYLNGADLTSVMDDMIRDGIQGPDGKTYHDGAYHSVDWTNYQALCSAIYTGPVKLGMAAGQLQNVAGVGEKNGWFAYGFRRDNNEDHCTGACGYGTARDLAALFAAKGVAVQVPSSVPPTEPCVAYYTWGTVGIMTHSSLVNTTGEAWVRVPSTAEQPAPPPPPNPTPTPTPAPGAFTFALGPGAPAGATLNPATGAFAWTVPADQAPGTVTIPFTVTNAAGTASGSFALTVTAAAGGVPVISPIPPQQAPAGSSFGLDLGKYVTTAPPGARP